MKKYLVLLLFLTGCDEHHTEGNKSLSIQFYDENIQYKFIERLQHENIAFEVKEGYIWYAPKDYQKVENINNKIELLMFVQIEREVLHEIF